MGWDGYDGMGWEGMGRAMRVCVLVLAPWPTVHVSTSCVVQILRSDTLTFVESSDYEPQHKRMTLSSHNTSFANIIHTKETSTFTEYAGNPGWTQFVQQGERTGDVNVDVLMLVLMLMQ